MRQFELTERWEVNMNKHISWAWAMVFCLFMTMYTGMKKV